jgi:hypothetical protein
MPSLGKYDGNSPYNDPLSTLQNPMISQIQHIYSPPTFRDPIYTLPVPLSPTYSISQGRRETIHSIGLSESSIDPFASYRSLIRSSGLWTASEAEGTRQGDGPNRDMIQNSDEVVGTRKDDMSTGLTGNRESQGSHSGDVVPDDSNEEAGDEGRLQRVRGRGRMMSFQNMLAGPGSEPGGGGG